MSHEFKFRAYSFLDKEFHYFDIYEGVPQGIAGGLSEPQQFTGLIDKNNNPIYEGDILTCDLIGGDDPQTVIFKDGIFTLDYLTPGCYTLHDEISQMVGHKVIGNIFENSKLIK